jgi:hypothetical protein
MSINSFFYEELSTAENRGALMRDDLWHIVVAAMNVAPKEMKVGAIKFYDASMQLEVELLNNVGFLVGHVTSANSYRGRKTVMKYKLSLINDAFSIRTSGGLSSTRAKYVAGKIRSKTDPYLRNSIIGSVHQSKFAPHAIVNRMAHMVLRKLNGDRAPQTPLAGSLGEGLVTQLVRTFVDDMHRSEISTADVSEIYRQFDKFKKERARFGETLSAVREFFSRDKWVIVSSLNEDDWTGGSMNKGRVIVGAISCQPLLAAFDYFAKNFALPSCNMGEDSFAYCQEIVPFTPYTSFEQVPEDIRKSIEVELMMRKVSRGTDWLYPRMDTGAKDVWQEGGQAIWRDYGEGTVTIVDKT